MVGAVARVLIAGTLGLLLMFRLDRIVLMRGFEFVDFGKTGMMSPTPRPMFTLLIFYRVQGIHWIPLPGVHVQQCSSQCICSSSGKRCVRGSS